MYFGVKMRNFKKVRKSHDIWKPLGRLGHAKMGQKLTFWNLRLESDSSPNFGDKHDKDTQKLFLWTFDENF